MNWGPPRAISHSISGFVKPGSRESICLCATINVGACLSYKGDEIWAKRLKLAALFYMLCTVS